jgi:hypothetical protein
MPWGRGEVPVENLATTVPYYEEYVEDSEGRRRHGEEVHRGNHFAMVPQECHPALAALRST